MWFWLNLTALFSGFALLTALVVLSRPSPSNEPAMNEMLAVLFAFFLLAVLSFMASYRGVAMRNAETFSDVILGLTVGLTLFYEWKLFQGYGTLRLPRAVSNSLRGIGLLSVMIWLFVTGLYTGDPAAVAADLYLAGGFILHATISLFTLLAAQAGSAIAQSTKHSLWTPLYRGFASACRITALAHLLNWITVNVVLQDVLFPEATIAHTEVVFVAGYIIANVRIFIGIFKTLGSGGVNLSGTVTPRREVIEQYGIKDREAEILRLLCDGNTNAQIAGQLGISVRTVDTHVRNLLGKCGVGSRLELYKLAAGMWETPSEPGKVSPEIGKPPSGTDESPPGSEQTSTAGSEQTSKAGPEHTSTAGPEHTSKGNTSGTPDLNTPASSE